MSDHWTIERRAFEEFRQEHERAKTILYRSNEVIMLAKSMIEADPPPWWYSSLRQACDLACHLNNAAIEQIGRMASVDPDYVPF